MKSYSLIIFSLFLQGCAAFTFFGVPLPWIGKVVGCFLLVKEMLRLRMYFPSPVKVVLIYALFSVLVTIATWGEGMEVSGMSQSYPVFIFLRYLDLIAFIGVFIATYRVCMQQGEEELLSAIIMISVILSIYALYAYAAHYFGLPVIPRNRASTGGGDNNALVYSYDFFRAAGSFQEPSHLAQWLVSPLLMVFFKFQKVKKSLKLCLLMAFLFTGSLLGIVSLGIAFLVYFYFSGVKSFKLWLYVILGGGSLAWVLRFFDVDVFGVAARRVENIIEGGMVESSRGDIYEFVYDNPPPFFGHGLGNSNLYFSNETGSDLVRTYANIFFDSWMSLGWGGVFLLLAFFGALFYRGCKAEYCEKPIWLAVTAGWLALYVGHVSHFDIYSALWFGIITYKTGGQVMKKGESFA